LITSTFDGLSLAWAIAEKLHKIGCYTLFATHYFELTALEHNLKNIINVHFNAIEHNDTIIFLHEVKPGSASQSYGIQVAKLAGLPQSIIQQASTILTQLENNSNKTDISIQQEILFLDEPSSDSIHKELINFLSEIDPNEISPKQALDHLYTIKSFI